MKFIDKNTIKLDKEINELDKFVFRFINILKKYPDYVIVSGYVAILLGRDRGTEDIDIILTKKINKNYPAYKEEVLKSNKDLEDARHMRIIAKGYLNENLINEYKRKLRSKR